MGNKFPKEQAASERTKLCPIKGLVWLKFGSRKDINNLLEIGNWKEVNFTIHQSLILIDDKLNIKISDNLLIISQNQTNLEIIFMDFKESTETVYIIKCNTTHQFKEFALAIFFSKRPSWIISPVCQTCLSSFSIIKRDHHCRNCGKNICSACSRFLQLEICGYINRQRVCFYCVDNVRVLGC